MAEVTNTNNANNVSFGKPKIGGAIFSAPLGTALPKNATSELDKAFKCLGYVSEDGVTNENSPDSEKTKAWGGDVVLVSQKEKEDNFEIELLPNYNISKIEEYFSTTFLTMSYTNEIKNKLEKLELTHSFEILKNWLDETWLFVSENKGIINKEAYFANLIVNGVAPITEKRKEELDKLENINKELIIEEDIKELNNSKFNIKSMQEIAKKTEFQKTEEKEEIEISREEFNMLFEEFYKLKKKENKIEQDTEFLKNVLIGEFKHRYKYKIID